MGCTFGTHVLQMHRGSISTHGQSTDNLESRQVLCDKGNRPMLEKVVPAKNTDDNQLKISSSSWSTSSLLKNSNDDPQQDTTTATVAEEISEDEISDNTRTTDLISLPDSNFMQPDREIEGREPVKTPVTSPNEHVLNDANTKKGTPEMSYLVLPPIPDSSLEPSRTQCIGNAMTCSHRHHHHHHLNHQHLPSLSLPRSPEDVKSKNSRRPSWETTVRPGPMTTPLRRQSSDITGDRTRTFLPSINSSRLRKSLSCNDSWLEEISDTCDSSLLPDARLPSITEVEVSGEDVNPSLGESLIGDDKGCVVGGVVPHKKIAPSQHSVQTRASWLTYCGDAKRSRLTREHSLTSSLENPRLPAIPEDLPAVMSSLSSSSSSSFSSTSTRSELLHPYEKVLKSVSTLTDSNLDMVKVHRTITDESNCKMLTSDINLDDDADHPNTTSSSTGYGSPNYIETMAELLGLKDDHQSDYQGLYKGNVTFDPSSPLLVNIVRNNDNGDVSNSTDGTDKRKPRELDNIVPLSIPVIQVNETNQLNGNVPSSENRQI